jgi:hypothetical protein
VSTRVFVSVYNVNSTCVCVYVCVFACLCMCVYVCWTCWRAKVCVREHVRCRLQIRSARTYTYERLHEYFWQGFLQIYGRVRRAHSHIHNTHTHNTHTQVLLPNNATIAQEADEANALYCRQISLQIGAPLKLSLPSPSGM